MDSRTLSYIRHLTASDRKTFVQKAAKAAEEVGELAKVALPFENAHGTTHRFIDRGRILEEVADVALTVASVACATLADDASIAAMFSRGRPPADAAATLCGRVLSVSAAVGRLAAAALALDTPGASFADSLSAAPGAVAGIEAAAADALGEAFGIARGLGFDDDDISEMLARKMLKWADLQSRDKGDRFPLPYEIHVTVAAAEEAKFRAACHLLGVKPVMLDLGQPGGEPLKDVMTSSAFYGHNQGALMELRRIVDGLGAAGFEVVRQKIETVDWHPAVPSKAHVSPAMPKGCYLECHLNILSSDDRRELLKLLAESNGAHLSRNIFKRVDADHFTVMMTLRRTDLVAEDFRAEVEKLKRLLAAARFDVEKEIVEFSIYDTKVGHDDAWLSGGRRHA
jgi:hypothetical protein